MAKPTSIKEALKRWEEKNEGKDITKAEEVGLQFMFPPIEKMDNSLSILASCKKLSLSTNMIEKITGLGNLKHLKILSLSRNYVKNFSGLEAVSDTLEELWVSYNNIEKLKGVDVLRKLKVLYMSNNIVKEWSEFNKLNQLSRLEDLLMVGNPLVENLDPEVWKSEAARRLPHLRKLDGEPILRDD